MSTDITTINLKPKTLEEAIEVINQLAMIIVELREENKQLKERLNTNSSNSSLPPSKDLKKKKHEKPKSGRKQGGQPGHKGSHRELVGLELVDKVVDCKPAAFCECGGEIQLSDKVQRHQVYEIPIPRYEVIEYQLYQGCCEHCQRRYKGMLPAGVSEKGFGARAHGMLGLLTSKYRLSKRLAQKWFKDVYRMPISLGSVSNVEHTVSHSLAEVHSQVKEVVQRAPVTHVDETGYKEKRRSGWAWVASTLHHTYFMLHRSRSKQVAKALIGDYQGRVIVTDRYASYNFLPDENHQLCWAHMKRDFQKIAEREGEAGRIGQGLLHAYSWFFHFWKEEFTRDNTLSKRQRKRLRYYKHKLIKKLLVGSICGDKKTMRTCSNILAFQQSLWRFFEIAGVPPTNNQAEQEIRPIVIAKKLTFGTQSERGSRFTERIFTVVGSCRRQSRDVLDFVIDAVGKYFSHQPPPSLVN